MNQNFPNGPSEYIVVCEQPRIITEPSEKEPRR